MFKPVSSFFHFNTRLKRFTHRGQQGMTLVEIILIAVFLATMAVGTTYFFAQTKVTMTSSSQSTQCSTIAKQALENVVSLGTRLYGYRIHHADDSASSYKPLFIKFNSSEPGNIEDVNSGSELSFPPEMYKTLYKSLGIPSPTGDPQANAGKPLIGSTYPFDISTSMLIINSVNALQYLYNSDNGFLTENSGKGKMYTVNAMDSGQMSSILEKYGDQFDLEDIRFYIKVAPIDLKTEKEMTSPPNKIITRPRFGKAQHGQLSSALEVLGDPDIGFEITLTLKYDRNDQEYACDASHRFSHQIKPIVKTSQPLSANMQKLESKAGKTFFPITPPDKDLKLTSCDTHGGGYEDITVTVDFNGIEQGQQIGTVILCQMNSYCRSYGDLGYSSCRPALGRWQRCHNIEPTGSDQSWTYTSKLEKSQVLLMTFSDMKVNRRYELYVGEFSMARHNLRKKMVSRFYIDAMRPDIGDRRITNDAVGGPTDKRGGRNYNGPFTYWEKPADSTNKWLQCDQQKVKFTAKREDQFTHNLEKCELKGKREDGTNKGTGVITNPTLNPTSDCAGELDSIEHGRQTITFIPSDSCGKSTKSKNLVWDTDLPNSFEAQDFPINPKWLKSADKDAYPIKTEIPAKNDKGKFPKHYSVDCDDNFLGTAIARQDGDSGQLSCELSGSVSDHDDGCNPIKMSSKYYHVCGGAGVCKDTKWAVYAPVGESCLNVQCEPGHICCDNHSDRSCTTNRCYAAVNSPGCTNPKGGSNQDSSSGCSDLGLYNCSYNLPCDGTAPFARTGPATLCVGKRQNVGTCSFPVDGTCTPNSNTNWQTSAINNSNAGTCSFSGTSYTQSCNPRLETQCEGIDEYRATSTPCGGTQTGICVNNRCSINNSSCTGSSCTVAVNGTCVPNAGTNWQSTQPSTTGTCSVGGSSCTAGLDTRCETEYRLVSDTCRVTVAGRCGAPSGGCTAKDVGGGNLTQEQCNSREGSCGPPPPCNPSTKCCPGNTYPSNPNCCVKVHGKACCLVAEGGDCTGQLCAVNCANPGTCHVRDVGDGVCRPSCRYIAEDKGYGGYGADGRLGTDDDPYTGTWDHNNSVNTCNDLNTNQIWGSKNWKKIPLIENIEPQEFVINGNKGECCGRNFCDPSVDCCKDDAYPDNPRCPELPVCNKDNKCSFGIYESDDTNDGNDPYKWICKSININPEKQEDCDVSEIGKCGDPAATDPADRCLVGTYDDNDSNDGNDPDKYICQGINGGDSSGECGNCDPTTACCEGQTYEDNEPHCPKDGVCSNQLYESLCSFGDKDDNDSNDGNDPHKYLCKGKNEGENTECTVRVDGECGSYHAATDSERCRAGTYKGPVTTDGCLYKWTCEGINEGESDDSCKHDVCGCSENSCVNTPPAGCTCQECDLANGEYEEQALCEEALPHLSNKYCYEDSSSGCWKEKDGVCPPNKRHRSWSAVDGRCLPSCGTACRLHPGEGDCASGDNCSDRFVRNSQTYDIIHMPVFYDENPNSDYQKLCCKRKSKPGGACSGSGEYAENNRHGCESGLPANQVCIKRGSSCWRRLMRNNLPQGAACDESVVYGCQAGTPRIGQFDVVRWKWYCFVAGGASSGSPIVNIALQVPCSKVKPAGPPKCGSPTTYNQCDIGTAINRQDAGSRWTWRCVNHFKSINCSKEKP